MDEYIKREEAIHIAFKSPFFSDSLMEEIKAIPAADVAPVRHGRWIPVSDGDQYDGKFYCSICSAHKFFPSWMPLSRYCYNCGAKMDGKDDENG